MVFRVLVLSALLCVACVVPHAGPGGLLTRLPPEPGAVVVHCVVPFLLAIALAVLWPRLSWWRALFGLAGGLLLGQVVRMAAFASDAQRQPWGRLLTDSKDQFLLALSLSLQLGSGLLALIACRRIVRKTSHAAVEPPGARG